VTATAASASAASPAVTPPPGNPRFALFDSLRAIAVLGVLAFHAFAITGALDRPVLGDAAAVLGSQGPILFFVISGFLLYRPYVAARAAGTSGPRAARYARRRALRILPAYWVALTALAIFPGIVGVFTGDWWRYYLFLQLYRSDTVTGGIPVAWTLCVEVSFYLLLPLWAMAVRSVRVASGARAWLRTEVAALGLVAAAGVAIQVAAARNAVSDLLATTLLGQCIWLALGMALAVASVAVERADGRPRLVGIVVERPGLCWLGAGASFVALTALLQPGGLFGIALALTTQQPIGKTLGAIALGIALHVLLVAPAVFGDRAGGLPRRVLAAPALAWLGLVSYGVYLWHLTVAQVLWLPSDRGHFSADGLDLATHIHHLGTPILFALTLAVSTAIAAASYYLVELPFLRLKER
jgi:peptidoglycan/LPS O-acetylase OafA/YrhL